jgi:2'-hydroxyisoflavone reductase
MDLLILGGTQFVGRQLVHEALERGHHVTTFTRGHTPSDLPETVETLYGDRDDRQGEGLGALRGALAAGRRWDAVLDVSGYLPRLVRDSAALLHGAAARLLFVSTVSVYADQGGRLTEDTPLWPEPAPEVEVVTGDTYGPLKVACERAVREVYGEAATILRPQIVAGAHDHTGRYTYWPDRLARGGEVLAPGDGHVQVIDVRDLARFALDLLEQDLGGTYNVAGPRQSWHDFLEMLQTVVQTPAQVHRVDAATLERIGAELPLYLMPSWRQDGVMAVDASRAQAAGLTLSSPEDTARDSLDWSRTQSGPIGKPPSPEQEAEWLRAAQG